MLQFSSSPYTPRPRPPRSRSSQLSASANSNPESPTAKSQLPTQSHGRDIKLEQVLSSLSASAAPPDTPPYTPEMSSLDAMETAEVQAIDAIESGSQPTEPARTAQELEEMLKEAHRVIQERERDLSMAASYGKSLLDNNIALRAKQDALLQRVQSPPKARLLGQSGQAVIPFPKLDAAGRTAKGEYFESLPPPSPRSSIGRSHKHRNSTSKDEEAWTDDEDGGNRSIGSHYPRKSSGSYTSPQSSRVLSGHARSTSRSSSISSIRVIGPTAPNSVTPSRSSSDRNLYNGVLSTPLQIQHQHAQLASQNAELERQLQDLEGELSQADVNGKKKLRRLDKELNNLRTELESALDRNKELEDRLGKKSSLGSSTSITRLSEGISHWNRRTYKESPEHDDAWLADILNSTSKTGFFHQQQPTNTDTDDNDDMLTPLPTFEDSRPALPRHASSPANLSRHILPVSSNNEAGIVAQLLSKISELQETNVAITESRAELDARLSQATKESEEMKKQYEFLEERVMEAELRSHKALGWSDSKGNIEWRVSGDEDESLSPATKLRRKALGNRSMIDRHRRLSSLYDASQLSPSQKPSRRDHPYGRAVSDFSNSSPLTTPEKHLRPDTRRSPSLASRLSISPLQLRPSLSRSASSVSEFFEKDDWEEGEKSKVDILDAIKRRDAEDKKILRQSQHLMRPLNEEGEDDLVGETSAEWRKMYDFKTSLTPSLSFSELSRQSISPSDSLKKIGHGQHTLASELGALRSGETETQREGATETPIRARQTSSGGQSIETVVAESVLVLAAVQTASQLAVIRHGIADKVPFGENDEDDDYRALMPGGPPEAESYDAFQATLSDLAITWADDEASVALIKDIHNRTGQSTSSKPKTSQGSLTWMYDDSEDSNSDNDPWKEEEEEKAKSQQAVESKQMVEMREKADERAARRRRRLQELARELLRDDDDLGLEEDDEEFLEKKMRVLRRLGSDESLEKLDKQVDDKVDDGASVASDFEQVGTDRSPGEKGTDYWPVSLRARYAPTMVAMRVRSTSQEYVNLILLWTRFLVVLAVAVAVSVWRGPKSALGLETPTLYSTSVKERRLLTRVAKPNSKAKNA